MLVRLTPKLAVYNTKVKSVQVTSYPDPGSTVPKEHVAIVYERGPTLYLPEELDFDTVVHALEGGCHYHKVYLDEVGRIDVCVQHDEISDEPDTGNKKDRFRQCNAVSIEHLLMPRKDEQ